MRRRVTMVLCLGLPMVAYSLAYAQPKGSTVSAAASSSSSSPTTSAASSSSPASPAAATPAASSAGPPAQVNVDMNTKPADHGVNGATYSVRLRDLEQRVDELKDQIRRSHTRLALLSDTILSGGAAGSRAEVEFKDEMSSAYLLVQALFVIDNQVQYNKQDDSGALAEQKDIPIYTGSVPPGDHTISVSLTFQGNGYGVFSYLRGYKFTIKSSHSFTAVEGKMLNVTATAYEEGGVTTPLEQRPHIQWHETLKPLTAGSGAFAPPPGASPVSGGPSVSTSTSVSVGGGKK